MYVTGTGMVCSVGLNAASACAAMRAGIAQFEELPYLDNAGEPIVGAMTPGLDVNLKYEQRLPEMLAMALEDCLKGHVPTPLESIPILLGLPEPDRPGVNNARADRIIGQVQEKLQVQFHPELSCTIQQGHTSCFEALQITRKMFKEKRITVALLCGVDSYIYPRSLLWLDHYQRLKTTENSDGVIPGEAAAAALIGLMEGSEAPSSVRVAGLGFAHEEAAILSQEPLLGHGLSQALRAALAEAGIGLHEIDFRLSDLTGESYGFREQMLALARVMRVRREQAIPIWHCAEFIGDIGAAAGFCQLVVASQAFKKGYAPGSRGVCYTSAVSGDRAIAVLETMAACRGKG